MTHEMKIPGPAAHPITIEPSPDGVAFYADCVDTTIEAA
jgi:hypothetical protein